jgi:hypothetical protein
MDELRDVEYGEHSDSIDVYSVDLAVMARRNSLTCVRPSWPTCRPRDRRRQAFHACVGSISIFGYVLHLPVHPRILGMEVFSLGRQPTRPASSFESPPLSGAIRVPPAASFLECLCRASTGRAMSRRVLILSDCYTHSVAQAQQRCLLQRICMTSSGGGQPSARLNQLESLAL